MEQVGRKDHVLFVNDSKATNADAAAPALSSFPRIYWIAGGLPKEGGIEPLRSYFPRIAKAYLIGEAAPAFSATLGEAVPYEISGTLAAAVEHAARDAASDDGGEVGGAAVARLAPASTSSRISRCAAKPSGQPSHAIEGVKPIGGTRLMLSRLDRSPVATWWWTVDRWFLAAFLSLMGLGIVLSFAASPAVAERIGLDSFHFATRQIIFMIPALGAMLAVSFLDARQIRRMSLVMLVRHAAC